MIMKLVSSIIADLVAVIMKLVKSIIADLVKNEAGYINPDKIDNHYVG